MQGEVVKSKEFPLTTFVLYADHHNKFTQLDWFNLDEVTVLNIHKV